MFKKIEKDSFYYGASVILLTTVDPESGADNITPISSSWTLDKYFVLGLGVENKGFKNLKINSDLTLNIPSSKLWKQVESISRLTGSKDIPEYKKLSNYQYCEDKFSYGNFTKLSGHTVQTKRIQECPIQIEAKVTEIMIRDGYGIVECKVLNIMVDENILFNDNYINVSKWEPLIYKFREYVTTGGKLGVNFRFDEHLDEEN